MMSRKRFFYIAVLLAFIALPFQSTAQFQDFTEMVQSGSEDISTYMNYYGKPFADAFGTGLTASWYNTAETHKKLGFDLTASMSLVVVPDANKVFTFDQSEYQTLSMFPAGSSVQLPTMMGRDPQPPEQFVAAGTVDGQQVMSSPFDAPAGIGQEFEDAIPFAKSSAPAPMVQLGIGTVKNTDLIVRWTPVIRMGENESTDIKIFGLALKHDIKQWIPGLKSLPFHMSILVGYTSLDMNYTLSSTPAVTVTNGAGRFKVNTWTIQGLASKSFSVLTLYGGLGYNTTSSNLQMNGLYEFSDATGTTTIGVQDPVNSDFSLNGVRFTAGARLKFSIFTLHADYTLQEYNTFTFGLGFSVR